MKDIEELARLVKQMRERQDELRRAPQAGPLCNQCRDSERRVDEVVKVILCPPTISLFDDQS